MANLLQRSLAVMPGGVSSPARSFKSVGCPPIFAKEGKGSKLITSDGGVLADYCCSWGALALGHARPEVLEAVAQTIAKGFSFGVTCELEIELAELICRQIPKIDSLRFVNSGTEAVMSAIRLARAFTKKDRILKFDGGYHGHGDAMLVSAGSGLLTHGLPFSAGVPSSVAQDILVAPYNDSDAVKEIFSSCGDTIAAVVVEPVACNMGLVLPEPGFLESLRNLSRTYKALLIFDEVISGFRFAPTSFGEIIGIRPDMTCLGKIIGGGFPVGAVGGRRDLMNLFAPNGPVYQAGTFSGNPVSMAAGLASLKLLISKNPYPAMNTLAKTISQYVNAIGEECGIPINCVQYGSAFTVFFTSRKPRNLCDTKKADTRLYANYFTEMLEKGIFLPPSQFETAFVSSAHNENDIENFFIASIRVLSDLC